MLALSRSSLLRTVYLLIATSGFATLSWEVIWQIKATLALGVSAWGTAITLAIMMGGMSLGGFFMGNALRITTNLQALRIYGLLEIIVGLSGLLLNSAFQKIERLDTWAYAGTSDKNILVFIVGMIAVLAIPTLCMGATVPVFAVIAKRLEASIAKLYSVNTIGAAFGALIIGLLMIPLFGVTYSITIIAFINIIIGFLTYLLPFPKSIRLNESIDVKLSVIPQYSLKIIFIVFVTGFATFTLEVAWFRSLSTIFPNTTDVFAIMLACMLFALGIAAKSIPAMKQSKQLLNTQLFIAGVLILLFTPIIERIDLVLIKQAIISDTPTSNISWLFNPKTFLLNWKAIFVYTLQIIAMFTLICFIIVPTMRYLGIAFPWIIDNQSSPKTIGKLYAINTLAAIIGAISTAWFLLPLIGCTKTSWLAGVLVILASIWAAPKYKRFVWIPLGLLVLVFAIYFETGIGKMRIQGPFYTDNKGKSAKILDFFEGPEATVAALEYNDGARILVINSTLAALESGHIYQPSIHYMGWMGYLPMLLHVNPKKVLVICFGTGQTANAVRKENPSEIDIVDINPNVYKLSHHFRSNENVLSDPRVNAVVMDGRAFMRRTKKSYDVITLEPMPPTTTGANALYSVEFYQLVRKSLSSSGVIAQWLPFHMVSPHSAASIAKTFRRVFPNAILWIDPDSKTGILLGSKDDREIPVVNWPGFMRNSTTHNLSQNKVLQAIALNAKKLEQYAAYGKVITDDNQLLAYGTALFAFRGLEKENFELLQKIKSSPLV